MAEGVARADLKLVRSPVSISQLPEMVQSVWPEASSKEVAAAAARLVELGIAVPAAGPSEQFEHRLWPFLRRMKAAVTPVDPFSCTRSEGFEWAVPLITPARLTVAGLHVFTRKGTSRVYVRRKTALNAINKSTLVRALRTNGVKGVALEQVYKEYETAFDDIFELAAEGTATIDEGLVWHAANVPKSTPGAYEAWRRALAAYKASTTPKK
jgi:hypothetical protein